MRNREEAQLSAALLEYLESAKPSCVYCAIPNGGSMGLIEATNLKRQGMIAGAADWVFTWHNDSGWIELKTKNGGTTDHQSAFRHRCSELQVRYQIARSLDDCIRILKQWGVV